AAEAECHPRGFRRLELRTSELQPAALALYRNSGYALVREVVAEQISNKTVGGGIRQHLAVGNIGRGRHHRVDQLAAAVDPKMPFHPEVPLVSFLGRMHLGIARLVGILGRGRRIGAAPSPSSSRRIPD